MIVMHGADAESLLKAAERLVDSNHPIWGPKEPEDVQLPGSEWGAGRRVVVDRRYHPRTGAILIRVPDPTISTASAQDEVVHAGAAHVARCAGVFKVAKEFANTWSVDMKRRICILHQACRMPSQYQRALMKLSEDSHASTLFVLTSTRPFSLNHGFQSRAVFVPIRNESPSPLGSKGFDPLGKALKALASQPESYATIVQTCADIDHSVAHIRSLGGDIVAARTAGSRLLESKKRHSPAQV